MHLYLTSSKSYVLNKILKSLIGQKLGTKILFIPTASEVEPEFEKAVQNDLQVLNQSGFTAKYFTFTNNSTYELLHAIQQVDGLLVSGGNTFYLLQQIKKIGFQELFSEFLDTKYYIGSSAGSIVVTPTIESAKFVDQPSLAPNLQDHNGLSWVDFEIIPHWGNPLFKDTLLQSYDYLYRENKKIVLISDQHYLEVKNHQVILI